MFHGSFRQVPETIVVSLGESGQLAVDTFLRVCAGSINGPAVAPIGLVDYPMYSEELTHSCGHRCSFSQEIDEPESFRKRQDKKTIAFQKNNSKQLQSGASKTVCSRAGRKQISHVDEAMRKMKAHLGQISCLCKSFHESCPSGKLDLADRVHYQRFHSGHQTYQSDSRPSGRPDQTDHGETHLKKYTKPYSEVIESSDAEDESGEDEFSSVSEQSLEETSEISTNNVFSKTSSNSKTQSSSASGLTLPFSKVLESRKQLNEIHETSSAIKMSRTGSLENQSELDFTFRFKQDCSRQTQTGSLGLGETRQASNRTNQTGLSGRGFQTETKSSQREQSSENLSDSDLFSEARQDKRRFIPKLNTVTQPRVTDYTDTQTDDQGIGFEEMNRVRRIIHGNGDIGSHLLKESLVGGLEGVQDERLHSGANSEWWKRKVNRQTQFQHSNWNANILPSSRHQITPPESVSNRGPYSLPRGGAAVRVDTSYHSGHKESDTCSVPRSKDVSPGNPSAKKVSFNPRVVFSKVPKSTVNSFRNNIQEEKSYQQNMHSYQTSDSAKQEQYNHACDFNQNNSNNCQKSQQFTSVSSQDADLILQSRSGKNCPKKIGKVKVNVVREPHQESSSLSVSHEAKQKRPQKANPRKQGLQILTAPGNFVIRTSGSIKDTHLVRVRPGQFTNLDYQDV